MESPWTEEGGTLWRTFEFGHYLDGAAFALLVARTAEELNHHPQIVIGYRQVTVLTTSHDAGNRVTDRDRTLAAMIDGLV